MDNEKKSPAGFNWRSLSLRAKLVLGFTILSAVVSALTARGIYNIIQDQLSPELRGDILEQSVLVVLVALGLGAFFGAVAGNVR